MRLTFLTCTAALIAAPAFAADLGTYRPGNPYHSVIVPTANVCESQCEGDAQCRGWNYVKAAPQAPGVCEFQSDVSEPIASAISISGVSNSAMPMSSRVISGNTNTIRVGTAVAPSPVTSRTTQSGRTIIRHPVPGHYPSEYSETQPGLRPALEGYAGPAPQMRQPVTSRGPARPSPHMRNVRPQAPQVVRPPAYAQPQYRQPQYQPPTQAYSQGRPPIGQPIAPAPRAQQRQTYQAPQIQPTRTPYTAQPPYAPPAGQQPQLAYGQAQAPQPMPRSSASNPVSWESVRAKGTSPRSTNLYGTLNDDLAPQQGIPTTGAYPAQPVTQMPLAGAYTGGGA